MILHQRNAMFFSRKEEKMTRSKRHVRWKNITHCFFRNEKTGSGNFLTMLADSRTALSCNHQISWFSIQDFLNLDKVKTSTFARNPWDRIVSYWLHLRQNRTSKTVLSLEDSIRTNERDIWFRSQLIYTHHQGKMAVDYLGRFENYEVDAKAILKDMGFDIDIMPHEHHTRTHKPHYSTYIDTNCRKVMDKYLPWLELEAEEYGYEF